MEKTAGAAPARGEERQNARRRLSSDERRGDFIRKSIELFAEDGFEGSTRELARRLGVTQPLLYRYFPSKQDLVSAVYEEVYLRRWRPEWEALLADRSRALRDRLTEFYALYTDAIFHPDWIRIYLYSGLKGEAINARYMTLVVERILVPIFAEARAEAGLPPRAPTDREIDKIWVIHGGIFYFGVIKLVYLKSDPETKDTAIGFAVDALVEGLKRELTDEPS
jgi:AcrR family transcriptional regulator